MLGGNRGHHRHRFPEAGPEHTAARTNSGLGGGFGRVHPNYHLRHPRARLQRLAAERELALSLCATDGGLIPAPRISATTMARIIAISGIVPFHERDKEDLSLLRQDWGCVR